MEGHGSQNFRVDLLHAADHQSLLIEETHRVSWQVDRQARAAEWRRICLQALENARRCRKASCDRKTDLKTMQCLSLKRESLRDR